MQMLSRGVGHCEICDLIVAAMLAVRLGAEVCLNAYLEACSCTEIVLRYAVTLLQRDADIGLEFTYFGKVVDVVYNRTRLNGLPYLSYLRHPGPHESSADSVNSFR